GGVPDSETASALFGMPAVPGYISPQLSGPLSLAGIVFADDAPAYTLSTAGHTLTLWGGGVVNTSGREQTLLVDGTLRFVVGGNAAIDTRYVVEELGALEMQNASSLGGATVVLQ